MTDQAPDDTTEPTEPSDPSIVRFVSQPTVSDLVWQNAEMTRRSAFITVVGTMITVTAGVALFLGDLPSIIFVLLGLSFLTGLFAAPFVWWSVRQRRDLLLAAISVEADDEALSMTSTIATTRIAWPTFRRCRESSRAFVLDTGAGAAMLLLKRGMGASEQAAFREILGRHGLLEGKPTLARRLGRLKWIALGLVIAAAVAGGVAYTTLASANVKIELVPTVDGRHLTIDGTTDLPDGTLLNVQMFQFDEWNKALAAGGAATEDFDMIDLDQAFVRGGHFSVETDMTGWPAGRGMAAAYFEVDESQPQEVIDRFGSDGSGLRGPGVRDDEGTGRMLRVDQRFDIP